MVFVLTNVYADSSDNRYNLVHMVIYKYDTWPTKSTMVSIALLLVGHSIGVGCARVYDPVGVYGGCIHRGPIRSTMVRSIMSEGIPLGHNPPDTIALDSI